MKIGPVQALIAILSNACDSLMISELVATQKCDGDTPIGRAMQAIHGIAVDTHRDHLSTIIKTMTMPALELSDAERASIIGNARTIAQRYKDSKYITTELEKITEALLPTTISNP